MGTREEQAGRGTNQAKTHWLEGTGTLAGEHMSRGMS